MNTENTCHRSGKFRYPSRTRIEAVLDSGVYEEEWGHPRSYYWCRACKSYHLTSQTPNRFYRKAVRLVAKVKPILTGDDER